MIQVSEDQFNALSSALDDLTASLISSAQVTEQADKQLVALIGDLEQSIAKLQTTNTAPTTKDLSAMLDKVAQAKGLVGQISQNANAAMQSVAQATNGVVGVTVSTPAPTVSTTLASTTPVETTTETPATTPTQNAAQGTEASASADVHAPAENPTTGA